MHLFPLILSSVLSPPRQCFLNETIECKQGLLYAQLDVSHFPPGTSKTLKVETYSKTEGLELLVLQQDRYGLPFQKQRFPLQCNGYKVYDVKVDSFKPPSKFGDGFMSVRWGIVPKDEYLYSAVSEGSSDFYDPY